MEFRRRANTADPIPGTLLIILFAGIASRSGLPLGEVVGLNILYDITAFDRKQLVRFTPLILHSFL